MKNIQAKSLKKSVHNFLDQVLKAPDYKVIPLAGDASARRYYRVVLGEESWVLMDWEPFKDRSRFPFINILNHFKNHSVGVPELIEVREADGLFLLEDLGDLTLERKFMEAQDQKLVLPFYFQAIDELVKIHYPCSEDQDSACVAFDVVFDSEKFFWEMNYGREQLIEKLLKLKLNSVETKALDDVFLDVCNRLDKEPKRISHRDYHSRNLMIKLDKMRVIDFQDARMGPIQYDLVSLIHDSYVQLNSDSERQILDYYMKKASEHAKLDFSEDSFYEIFEIQMIQRCFKACGSFASFYNNRHDGRYLKYIQPTLLKVVKTLKTHSNYQAFEEILLQRGLLEKDYTSIGP